MKDWRNFEAINTDLCAQLWSERETERFEAALEKEDLQELASLYDIAEERAEANGITIEFEL